ncbi:MAG: cytochrome C [Pseudomonas sp. PGPPP3]|nr:MAG: cytochrome C [Pseudomonas sp. PGPPP3]
MPRTLSFKSKLLVIVLAGLSLAACERLDPNSPLGQRKAIFKQMLKTSEQLGGMLRGRISFNEADFVAGASQLDVLVKTPWQHFPQVRDEGKSSAKDEVWQNQQRFNELARQLEMSTAGLLAATAQKPLTPKTLVAPLNQVEAACKACHQEFRDY